MTGQVWSVPSEGGYLHSVNLSDYLRFEMQPLTKFRNLCDAKDDALGLHEGDTYNWNVYSNVATAGGPITEQQKMPETNFTISQKSLTVTEYGNSVPYSGKLEALGEHDVKDIINQTLRDDARKTFDRAAVYQFDQTKLHATPTGGNSTTSVTVNDTGTSAITNNVAMGSGHVKALVDHMKERNIPAFAGDDYVAISHPSTFRGFKNDLEGIHQYTDTGINKIFSGEVGRYESCRFIEQNSVPKGHAVDAAFSGSAGTNYVYDAVDDPWDNGLSSWAYFMGADTVAEAPVIPEEIRAKIPGDFGRSKAIAWYYMGGFGICHDAANDSRIIKWSSAA